MDATTRLRTHWPEYLMEAGCLGLFMFAAASAATVLQHPASPLAVGEAPTPWTRLPMGVAMGATAVGIIHSPWGLRSGAHMNPAITLTFLRLGKIAPGDALGYVIAQFAGGIAGIAAAIVLLACLPADPAVNYVATLPGPRGALVAFLAEAAISFGMMTTVLLVSNHSRWRHLTGVCAGTLVCLYITLEAPLSGMSMNPARTFGPAVFAHALDTFWIYLTAPLAGMLLAAEVYVRLGRGRLRCGKLLHPPAVRCIFRCGYAAAEEVV